MNFGSNLSLNIIGFQVEPFPLGEEVEGGL